MVQQVFHQIFAMSVGISNGVLKVGHNHWLKSLRTAGSHLQWSIESNQVLHVNQAGGLSRPRALYSAGRGAPPRLPASRRAGDTPLL